MTRGNCPECNCDRFKCVDWEKTRKEYLELQSRFRRVLAGHGEREAKWTVREIELEEGMKYLQQKVIRQANHLKKLEDKLIKLGQKPYWDPPEITGM